MPSPEHGGREGARSGGGTVLITGGAGFIGTNLAARLLADGGEVMVLDNLSRPGVEHNLQWLRETHGRRLHVHVAGLRDTGVVREAVAECDRIYHFASQVAVTTGLANPAADFETNLRGTFDLLEAVRRCRHPPSVIYTSTNKVYGALDDIDLETTATRHQPRDATLRAHGIGESRRLDFHTPYGCSKGGADQYVLDYARSYGIPATVLRLSCVYGPHQLGNQDQGWIAHFLLSALEGREISVHGDGLQVRDALFVDDMVDALLRCGERVERMRGMAFNVGGGADSTTSVVELLERVRALTGAVPGVRRQAARPGDQRWYASDTRAFAAATGWSATVGLDAGLERLHDWLLAHRVARPAVARSHAA